MLYEVITCRHTRNVEQHALHPLRQLGEQGETEHRIPHHQRARQKSEPADHTAGGGSQPGAGLPLGLDRITSYNVCYTKLLRALGQVLPYLYPQDQACSEAESIFAIDIDADPRPVSFLGLDRITSYNVCYTKLLRS